MLSNTSLHSDRTDLLSTCLRIGDVGVVVRGDSIAMANLINSNSTHDSRPSISTDSVSTMRKSTSLTRLPCVHWIFSHQRFLTGAYCIHTDVLMTASDYLENQYPSGTLLVIMLTCDPVISSSLMGILPGPKSKYLNAWYVLSQGLCAEVSMLSI